ncbi:FG-GAP-like repeat-containing protein [Pseudodesulfovibrio tunisiensis]|uniref:FG-GAP-like repeat-containing protein n=1 Tax=Pseudodesulfovibrio tunisiensis TaxID=463192 RepID=UPI001FB40EBD|nr:FG-GAP-like repeat-containing protein [Pseudodesulfovibrio tunisiensis]
MSATSLATDTNVRDHFDTAEPPRDGANDAPFGTNGWLPELSESLVSYFSSLNDTTEITPSPQADIELRDMDHDGDMDILVTPHAPGTTPFWVENMGQGAKNLESLTNAAPMAVGFGDLNGNGSPDLVIGFAKGLKIVFSKTGDIHSPGVILDNPRAIHVADVDRDGANDIIVRDSDQIVLLQNSDGPFGSRILAWPDLGDHSVLAVGELDRTNAMLEFATINGNTNELQIIRHDGTQWHAANALDSDHEYNDARIADVNHDGYCDITATDCSGHAIWFRNDGAGEFSRMTEMPAQPRPETIPHADVEDEAMPLDNATSETDSGPPPPDDQERQIAAKHFSATIAKIENSPDDQGKQPDSGDFSEETGNLRIDLESGTVVRETPGNTGSTMAHTDATNASSGSGRDIVEGTAGDNTLSGNQGGDQLFGRDGNDTLRGGADDDALFGGNGQDRLSGDADRDILVGNQGNDLLDGGTGQDYLFGGDGNDLLIGGADQDYLFGGRGSDVFAYKSADHGNDRILDFNPNEDTVELDFSHGPLIMANGEYSGISGTAGSCLIWESSGSDSGSLIYDEDGSQLGGEHLIAAIDLADTDADFDPGELLTDMFDPQSA